MRKLFLLLILCGSVLAQSRGPTEITEEDGTPSTYPYKLKFPNATVTDNGDATTSVTFPAGYTDEEAQDAVGTILSDGGDIDFTYDDATPAISGVVKVDSVALTTDTTGNYVASVATTTPLSGGAAGSEAAALTLTITDSAADGATKGAASFTATDFDSSSGNIAIDYTNGQAASGSTKGFLTAADWTTFNGKASVVGSDTQVIFNDGGSAFNGDAGMVYDKTGDILTVLNGYFNYDGSYSSNYGLNAFGVGVGDSQITFEGATANNFEYFLTTNSNPGSDLTATLPALNSGTSSFVLLDVNYDTSAELAGLITNETGNGSLVFQNTCRLGGQLAAKSTDTVTAATQTIGDSALENEIVNPNSDYTLTSTPSITNGTSTPGSDDRYSTFYEDSAEANVVTIQDADTLANSGVHLNSPVFQLNSNSHIRCVYRNSDWYEESRFPAWSVQKTDTTTTGNVGIGEDNLLSSVLEANTARVNGDSWTFTGAGTIASSLNAKRIKVKYGATTIFDTGAAGIPISSAIDWMISGQIIRTGAATQKCIVWMNTNNSTLASYCDYTTATETLTSDSTLQFTGEATDNNDIVQEIIYADFKPAHGN